MQSTTPSPLVEPDVQVSRIRLSRKLSPQGSTLAGSQLSRGAKPRSQMRMIPQPCGWFVRRGTHVQAEFPSSYLDRFAFRPLRSTVVTRFFANMDRSDSRTGPLLGLCLPQGRWLPPPRRASQVPRLICPRVLSPLTPESPKAAFAHYFTSGSRLHHTWKTGHFPFALTGPDRVRCHYGSRVRRPELCQSDRSSPRLVGYLLYEQLQGKLLSAYKISQAFPGVPAPRYALLRSGTRESGRRVGSI